MSRRRTLVLWTTSKPSRLTGLIASMRRLWGGVPNFPTVRLMANQDAEWSDLPVPSSDEVVVVMGAKLLARFAETGLCAKNASVSLMRGRMVPAGEKLGLFAFTNDPWMALNDHKAMVNLQCDLSMVVRYLCSGRTGARVGDYSWVRSFDGTRDLIKRSADEAGKAIWVTEDLETVGLWPWYDDRWIVSIAFTAKAGSSHVMKFPSLGDVPSTKDLATIEWIESCDEVKLAGANLKFDNVWKKVKWGLEFPSNFKMDTLVAGSLVDEGRSNSLSVHTRIYAPELGGYDEPMAKFDKSRMDLVLRDHEDEFLEYAGGDTDACHRVRSRIGKELVADDALANFYTTILHPGVRAFERLERRGVVVDAEKLRGVGEQAKQASQEAFAEMVRCVPMRLRRKWGTKIKFTPAQLRDLFFSATGWGLEPRVLTKKSGQPSTSIDEHLKMFGDEPEVKAFLDLMRTRNKADKIRSSYVEGFLKHLRPDGRFHATYNLFAGAMYDDDTDDAGTNTGRSSAKNPHIQTIPKRGKWAKLLRACYPAPPGYEMFNVDVSQGELKITACIADEQTMLDTYRRGEDLHLKTGSKLAKLSYEEALALRSEDRDRYDEIRYGGKAPNFGLIYGQQAKGYVNYAYKQWDLVLSLAESQSIHDDFFALYPGLTRWHRRCEEIARRDKMIRSPLGRIRHLPMVSAPDRFTASKAFRQAINSPVQATLSDLAVWAISIAELELDLASQGLLMVGMTHDNVWGYVRKDRIYLVGVLADTMENLPIAENFGWEPQLKFTVDAELGADMASLEPVDRNH